MHESWIQFGILMLTLLAFILRNEHRLTVLEQKIQAGEKVDESLERRIANIESRPK